MIYQINGAWIYEKFISRMPNGIDIKKYTAEILNYIIGKDLSAELPQKIVYATTLVY